MNSDEARKVWRQAYDAGMAVVLAEPARPLVDQLETDRKADEAAATVIQQAFAERDGEMRKALEGARGIIEQIAPDFKFHVSEDSKLRRIERANRWLEKADILLEYSK